MVRLSSGHRLAALASGILAEHAQSDGSPTKS
jgi:hypothetical protein